MDRRKRRQDAMGVSAPRLKFITSVLLPPLLQ
jgi:hypothetical protein